jgi:nucleoid-associated protein YgaU
VAADHLPATATNAQIAQAWPRWWSANRAAVGADPDLIHPGLSLTPPTR